jgi:hypothetical protein
MNSSHTVALRQAMPEAAAKHLNAVSTHRDLAHVYEVQGVEITYLEQ